MVMETIHDKFMWKAILLSKENINNGGGPFAAIVVKEDEIIASAVNRVTLDNDPTAHAEVNAIREACKKLNTFDLSDCTIYTSCEPCPMCLGAIYWAHIGKVYYGNTKHDAGKVGFDDSFIYQELEKPIELRNVKFLRLLPEEALEAFQMWNKLENKTIY